MSLALLLSNDIIHTLVFSIPRDKNLDMTLPNFPLTIFLLFRFITLLKMYSEIVMSSSNEYSGNIKPFGMRQALLMYFV